MKTVRRLFSSYFFHPIFLVIGGILPCLVCLSYYFYKANQLDNFEQKILYLNQKKQWTALKQANEKELLARLQNADRDYVEHQLEPLQFLKPEIKKIKALLHSDPSNKSLKARLQFLEGRDNKLMFTQKNFGRVKKVAQVEEVTKHPIEINPDDLRDILVRIENGKDAPQLIVKKFQLQRKQMPSREETYLAELELIKREMINE